MEDAEKLIAKATSLIKDAERILYTLNRKRYLYSSKRKNPVIDLGELPTRRVALLSQATDLLAPLLSDGYQNKEEALRLLGYAHRELKHSEKAVDCYRTLFTLSDKNEYKSLLSGAYFSNGAQAEAIKLLSGEAHKSVVIANLQTFRNWIRQKEPSCEVVASSVASRLFSHSVFEGKVTHPCMTYEFPELVMGRMLGVTFISPFAALTPDNTLLFDAYEANILFNNHFGGGYIIAADQNHNYLLHLPKSSVKVTTPCILLGSADSNYFHWLFQVIPRLVASAKYHNRAIAVFGKQLSQWQLRLLQLAGIDPERQLILLPTDEPILFRDLFYISQPDTFSMVHPWAVRAVRKVLLPKCRPPPGKPQKVFLDRSSFQNRTLRNQREIMCMMAKWGFVAIRPEKLKLEEQIGLFQQSEVVVGATGAAFANLAFSSPRLVSGIFSKVDFESPVFPALLDVTGARRIFFASGLSYAGESMDSGHWPYSVTLSDCQRMLDYLLCPIGKN